MYVIKFYMHFTITCMHFYHIHLCLSCIQCACSACVQYGSCTCLYVIACYLHAYHNHAFVYSYTVHVLLHLHACHNYLHAFSTICICTQLDILCMFCLCKMWELHVFITSMKCCNSYERCCMLPWLFCLVCKGILLGRGLLKTDLFDSLEFRDVAILVQEKFCEFSCTIMYKYLPFLLF